MENNRSTCNKHKNKRSSSECRVCGVEALYSYYGAIACHSCKTFFRRNVLLKQKTRRCHFDGHCQIDGKTRHACTACRLDKCLQVGMHPDRIRGPTCKGTRVEKLSTVSLLEKDLSSLSDNQWITLRNLTNTYDHTMTFLVTDQMNILSRNSMAIDPTAFQALLTPFYEVAGAYLRLNADIHQLSFDDRTILLHTAADNITCLGGIFAFHHACVLDNGRLWSELEHVYGKRTMDCQRWSARFIQPDLIVFKLGLALFAVSTNSRSFNRDTFAEYANAKQLFSIESQYAELTWKYLIYKYQQQQAIKIFLQLIQWFSAVTLVMSYAQNSQSHVNDISSLIEQTELALVLDDADRLM